MKTSEILENWNETKAKLKEKFTILTDNDLSLHDGQKEELGGRIQSKLGKTKEEWRNIIAKL